MTPQPSSPVPVQPIRDPVEHEAAMAELAALWGAALGTAQGDRLDALATAIDAYEVRTYPMGNEAA
jgi:HTH-type transcriptional regulator/antitoxin HigA